MGLAHISGADRPQPHHGVLVRSLRPPRIADQCGHDDHALKTPQDALFACLAQVSAPGYPPALACKTIIRGFESHPHLQ